LYGNQSNGGGSSLGIAIHLEIYFRDYPFLYKRLYGNMVALGGAGRKDFALETITDGIERAVTDFGEVNFLMDDQ
jgi:hypothetical protein